MVTRSIRATRAGLPAQRVLQKEEEVRRPLAEPAHEVRVPLGAVRRRDEDGVAAPYDIELQLRPNAVQHLELELLAGDVALLGEADRVVDQRRVVRRKRRVARR